MLNVPCRSTLNHGLASVFVCAIGPPALSHLERPLVIYCGPNFAKPPNALLAVAGLLKAMSVSTKYYN